MKARSKWSRLAAAVGLGALAAYVLGDPLVATMPVEGEGRETPSEEEEDDAAAV